MGLQEKIKKYLPELLLITINLIVWYPALNFWFFRAWEPQWLLASCGTEFSLYCLMQNHGFLYFINYKLFGWNATGWYFTAIILHTFVSVLLYKFIETILKNKTISFLAALTFSVSVVHNDVVNWGSFEGLYALLLVLYILSFNIYRKIRENEKKFSLFWYITLILLFSFSLYVREVSLILPFFLLSYEIALKGFKLSRKRIFYLFKFFLPFGILSLVYLYIRGLYGGAANDFVDAMVQLRITLLSQGQYYEYIKRGVFAFGRFIGPHLVPYPILNSIRDFLATKFSPYLVNYYFFSLFGLFYFALLLLALFIQRKSKNIKILIFAFLVFFIPTIFFSYAFTITDDAILKEYVWDSSRWRYFSYMGSVIFWFTFFYGFFENKRRILKNRLLGIITILISLFVLLNIVLLRTIQHKMYSSTFGPAKNFYSSFLKDFPSLSTNYVFYHNPSTILNDYLAEWYRLRLNYYPNLTEERRDWAENNMEQVLIRLVEKTVRLDDIHFLDMDKEGNVIDVTNQVVNLIKNSKKHMFTSKNFNYTENGAELDLKDGLNVEIPYNVKVSLHVASISQTGKTLPKSYVLNRLDFLNNARIDSVCATAPSGSSGMPSPNLLPEHLVDGSFGGRSIWVANCRRPAWLIIDLGHSEEIGGFSFHTGKDTAGTPREYTISYSNDKKNWTELKTVVGNDANQRTEIFEKSGYGRYVKMDVLETSRGGFTELDEVAVYNSSITTLPDSVKLDFESSEDLLHVEYPFVELTWETTGTDTEINKFMYRSVMANDGVYQFKLNESEYYSVNGEFLKRKIDKIIINVTNQKNFDVKSVEIVPRYDIN